MACLTGFKPALFQAVNCLRHYATMMKPKITAAKLVVKANTLLLLLLGINKYVFSQSPFSIILGRPTDTSITASVMFNQASQFYIEYGSQPGVYSQTTATYSAAAEIPDEIDLRNLQANTRYYYRLQYQFIGDPLYTATNEFSFITQRAKETTFRFTIEADEHLYDKKGIDNMYKVTLANQAKDKPDFMLSLGDIFGDDHSYLDHTYTITAGELDTLHKVYRPFLGELCHSVPFYVALGNHEGERKHHFNYPIPPPDNLPVNGTLARKKYYPNPYPNTFYSGNTAIEAYGVDKPENYYAWEWGDALFVILDPYRYDSRSDTSAKPGGWDWTLGIQQYSWLKNTLETSAAKYKFVFAHHVRGEGRGGVTNALLYEWGGYQSATGTTGNNFNFPQRRPTAEGWTKPIHQVFKDNKVSAFFQGHDHVFAHEMLDSIVYQSVPMAADSTYEIGFLANADSYISDTLDGTGHIRVTVTPAYAKVDYIRAYLPADTVSGIHHNGEVAFSYYIRPKNTFTFIGNGNWSLPENWIDKAVPPATLASGFSIYVEPAAGGECLLNITQNISPGAKIIINPDKKFIVPGNLNIQ